MAESRLKRYHFKAVHTVFSCMEIITTITYSLYLAYNIRPTFNKMKCLRLLWVTYLESRKVVLVFWTVQ